MRRRTTSFREFLSFQKILIFFLQQTDRQTDRPTDRPTLPGIELLSQKGVERGNNVPINYLNWQKYLGDQLNSSKNNNIFDV